MMSQKLRTKDSARQRQLREATGQSKPNQLKGRAVASQTRHPARPFQVANRLQHKHAGAVQ